VHSIEKQALPQVRSATKIVGDPEIATAFERHIAETESQEQRVRERLEALGGSPSKVKDVAGALSGPAFVLFAKSQPDTPRKLVTHAYSYEHMELAAYELLSRVAIRAADEETASLAQQIAEEERRRRVGYPTTGTASSTPRSRRSAGKISASSSTGTSERPTRSRRRPTRC
jgi:ferritin-like metal-binding protein YciE